MPSEVQADRDGRSRPVATVPSGGRSGGASEAAQAPLVDASLVAVLAGPLAARPGDVRVLDCGGGSGRYAVPLAVAGATVTVIDISVDALAVLRRRAQEAGVADRVIAVQGDVEALGSLVGDGDGDGDGGSVGGGVGSEGGAGSVEPADLVLAHGILESVEDVAATFASLAAALRPDGVLSVLVANPVAAVLARALAGDLGGAERELAVLGPQGHHAPTPAAILDLCRANGLGVEAVHGIGVFRDLVPGHALDAPGARDALDRLERACASRAPFADIAGRVHVLARRGEHR